MCPTVCGGSRGDGLRTGDRKLVTVGGHRELGSPEVKGEPVVTTCKGSSTVDPRLGSRRKLREHRWQFRETRAWDPKSRKLLHPSLREGRSVVGTVTEELPSLRRLFDFTICDTQGGGVMSLYTVTSRPVEITSPPLPYSERQTSVHPPHARE